MACARICENGLGRGMEGRVLVLILRLMAEAEVPDRQFQHGGRR